MNKIITLLTLTFFMVAVQAQIKTVGESHLLKHYYELKDALVNGDPVTAAYKITDVINALDGSQKITVTVQKKLRDAGKVLDKQREAFSNLSLEMYGLAKTEKLSADPVYEVYCPMKKAYWLSHERVIKNPYYGKSMLDCGNIVQTILP